MLIEEGLDIAEDLEFRKRWSLQTVRNRPWGMEACLGDTGTFMTIVTFVAS